LGDREAWDIGLNLTEENNYKRKVHCLENRMNAILLRLMIVQKKNAVPVGILNPEITSRFSLVLIFFLFPVAKRILLTLTRVVFAYNSVSPSCDNEQYRWP
jgi:hypothetical protein